MGSSGGLTQTRQWAFRLYKIWKIYWILKRTNVSFTRRTQLPGLRRILNWNKPFHSCLLHCMAANGAMLDATQEMITLGLCNIVGSFLLSMPISGSFTRSAVNNSSGVRTPFGGLYTGIVCHVRVALFPVSVRSGIFILCLISVIAKD